MTIWAIGDLHLSFGVPDKAMDFFGPLWKEHAANIEKNWRTCISPQDLVLIPGDISWAMRPEEAVADLAWIDHLPGTKVIIRGNHDFWWSSIGQVRKILPPSIHAIQNDVFRWQNYSIAGARLWDTSEYSFGEYIVYQENPRQSPHEENPAEDEKIFVRELGRLELSLKALGKDDTYRIAMTHYPPIGAHLQDSRASQLLEKYGVKLCVFGHLHNLKPNAQLFGERNDITYLLTSCDYLNFKPLKIKGP